MKTKICIASSNEHKISEFRRMFADAHFDCEVFGVGSLDGFVPPVEDGSTFAENALIKARAARTIAPADAFVMADDSGICVDALGGAPGIFSARYAGADGKDADKLNNRRLLAELENVPDEKRTAKFVCDIALIPPSGETEKIFTGEIAGVINHAEAGAGGFGYDPLFYLPERGVTTAELPPQEKNAISHRGRAFSKMVNYLKSIQ